MVTLLAHHAPLIISALQRSSSLLSLPAKSSNAFYLHIPFLFSASWPTQVSLE